jgi:hypothetical protein
VPICPKCGKPGTLQFTHTYRYIRHKKVRYTYPAFVHYAGYRGSTRKLKVCLRGWRWFLAYRKEAVEEYYAKMKPFEMVGTWKILGIPLDTFQQADTDYWRAERTKANRKRRKLLKELRPESAPRLRFSNITPEIEAMLEAQVKRIFG